MRFFFPLLLLSALSVQADVQFNRDIRPILSANCIACHGSDAHDRKAKLRLDIREGALQERDGIVPVTPGDPSRSEVYKRIAHADPEERMPPVDSGKKLDPEQIALLKQWIAEGAEWQGHWAFDPPQKAKLPDVKNPKWINNPVDRFVLAAQERKGMKPAPPAARETLVRRLSIDLRGIPPTLKEIDAFVNDPAPDAYARLVERMLASPHYGEKLAAIWMDLASYGDTNGYHFDSTRPVWLWRDWVIRALNDNMPFDRFSIEQLAGDLLPEPTLDQKVASGFNRNTRFNEEGGADPDEWLVRYAVDRTVTLGRVWLGLTLNCAECHSHKYDPISQKEFYQLYAFFNSLEEVGAGGSGGFHNKVVPPVIRVPHPDNQRRIAEARAEEQAVDAEIKAALAGLRYREPEAPDRVKPPEPVDRAWVEDDTPAGVRAESDWNWVAGPDHPVQSGKRSMRRSGAGVHQHYFHEAKQARPVAADDVLYAHVWLDPKNPPESVMLQFNDGGWEHRAYWGANKSFFGKSGTDNPNHRKLGELPEKGKWVRLEVRPSDVGIGAKPLLGMAFTQFGGTAYWDNAGIRSLGGEAPHHRSLKAWEGIAAKDNGVPGPVREAIAKPERSPEEQQRIVTHYLEHVYADTRKVFEPLHARREAARRKVAEADKNQPQQLVSVELKNPRPAHVLIRGNFLTPGEPVQRAVPEIFPDLPEGMPRNRLALARWLFDPAHPMTARVTVNRLWAQVFGSGLVETVGDFGTQGNYPSHPELLDWLAVEFRESGWDQKHILRLIVNSSAYRQAPVNADRYTGLDPRNRLLTRSPRFRVPAEELRDIVLFTAGMLYTDKIGGEPVYPHQPKDYYRGKKGGWSWNLSPDRERYRRGMYTFWRRTTPYPLFMIFDASDRSECTVSRPRTNTPLQALATLNGAQFVEAARVFGQRILSESGPDDPARAVYAFRLATGRPPDPGERAAVLDALPGYREHFKNANGGKDAAALAATGDFPRIEGLDPVEHAAWTAVANSLLNLDETITRE